MYWNNCWRCFFQQYHLFCALKYLQAHLTNLRPWRRKVDLARFLLFLSPLIDSRFSSDSALVDSCTAFSSSKLSTIAIPDNASVLFIDRSSQSSIFSYLYTPIQGSFYLLVPVRLRKLCLPCVRRCRLSDGWLLRLWMMCRRLLWTWAYR